MTATADGIRLDRATLTSPVERDDGTVVYSAVLATVGEPLVYSPTRTEVATEEALSDRAYLDGLVGLPVTLRHPAGLIGVTIPRDDPSVRRVGVVLSADFVDGQVVIRIAIFDPEALDAIRSGMRDLSDGYFVPPGALRARADGVMEQTKRLPNHIALEYAGRAASAMVRTDAAGGIMEGEPKTDGDLMARYDALVAERDQIRKDMASRDSELADLRGRMAAIMEALGMDEREDSARMDSATATTAVDRIVSQRVADLVALRARAVELGIEVPADDCDPASVRRHIGAALGIDGARLDSADYVQGRIDAAPAKSAAAAFAGGYTRGESEPADTYAGLPV